MRISTILAIGGTFLAAALLSLVAARFAALAVEDGTETALHGSFREAGLDWAEVHADGLQVFLAGTAPDEATRFRALSLAGTRVDAARLIDQMLIEERDAAPPPRFSVEILRNDSGLSLIGLVPAEMDRAAFTRALKQTAGGADVGDLLQVSDDPAPEGWRDALGFARRALDLLDRAKISVGATQARVIAMADSPEARRRIEAELTRAVPPGMDLALEISAPRPVVTPYSLRLVLDEEGARFDSCAADTEAARARILKAAEAAGVKGRAACPLALGVPSPQWGRAAQLAIAALAELGRGSVTFRDADIALRAAPDTPQARFDRVVGELDAALPELFALNAVLPEPEPDKAEADAPEVVATLSPEGLMQIRGRIGSELAREAVDSLARARFRSDAVHTAMRVAKGELPDGWTRRVLAGVEALAYLSHGVVTVTAQQMTVDGSTGREEAAAMIARHLSERLGEDAAFDIDVDYREVLDPVAQMPSPEECRQRIAATQTEERKIGFEPGSATIDVTGARILDDIADILRECGEIRLEIGGHTDSQGRETMNQRLSLDRARAVLEALRMRRVLTSGFTARGYGESRPIADNDTDAGREANRRIEFRLIRDDAEAADESGAGDSADLAPAGDGLASGGKAGDDAATASAPRDAGPDADARGGMNMPAEPPADGAGKDNAGDGTDEQD